MDKTTLKEEFIELHHKLVDTIAEWCKKKEVSEVEYVGFQADGFEYSVAEGKWNAGTDSSLVLVDNEGKVILASE